MLALLQELFESSRFFGLDDAPLKARLTPGDGQSRLLVLTGSNASGKSFAVRVMASWIADDEKRAEALQVSMRYRTMSGMHRAFMYGPFGDSEDSTGSVSMVALKGGLRTAQGRVTPVWLMLDEPDTGLSEDYGYALGQYIARNVNEATNPQWKGTVVVTHSRELVQGLVDSLAHKPHFAHAGDAPLTLDDWLQPPRRRSVDDLLSLSERSMETHRAIQRAIEKAKKEQGASK